MELVRFPEAAQGHDVARWRIIFCIGDPFWGDTRLAY
jgi:hypothetical protein